MKPSGLLVIGLDSVPAEFVFDRFRPVMPNLRRLIDSSRHGVLLSTDPPITVPAWAVMFSGMDPGSLGLYGFHHRQRGTYWGSYLPAPSMVRYPQVWDFLSQVGKRVCVIGMPPGYPPPKVNGVYISDFLTPKTAQDFVWPASLTREVLEAAGGTYDFDVTFRAEDRDRVGRQLVAMTQKRFSVARRLLQREPWDFFAVHEIGPDRLHHTFWKYFDRDHPRYEENESFRTLVEDYYRLMDEELGSLVALAPDNPVLVVSDHGSQAMTGCFCINQWLQSRGWLVLRTPPERAGTALEKADVDWSRTKAWGAGGYYARIFLNLKGREAEGALDPREADGFVEELRSELGKVRKPDGTPLGCRAFRPSEAYRRVQGDAPDLMLYFGDLKWRSAGTVGHPGLFLSENDTGPDDAVHSFEGFFVLHTPGNGGGTRLPAQRIMDIAPTLLRRYALPVPPHMLGRPIDALVT